MLDATFANGQGVREHLEAARGALTARWYIDWLDRYRPWIEWSYYFPRGVGLYPVGIITSPMFPS